MSSYNYNMSERGIQYSANPLMMTPIIDTKNSLKNKIIKETKENKEVMESKENEMERNVENEIKREQ